MTTTVLLVDDHELIRNGLAGAFTRDDAFRVVIAKHVEGLATAESVAATLEERIRVN